MELIKGEGAPPPLGRSGGTWAAAKAAVLTLKVGENLTIKGLRRGSVLAIAPMAAAESGGKFSCRTNPDRSVTIYRTA